MYFLCHLYIICTICTAHCWPIQCCIYLSKEIFAQEVPFAQCLSCTFSSPSESSATQASPCWLLQLSPQQCSSERCLMKNTKKWKFMQIFLIYFGYILWPLLSPTPLRFTLLSLCLSLASENASVATLSRTTGRCVCRVVRDWSDVTGGHILNYQSRWRAHGHSHFARDLYPILDQDKSLNLKSRMLPFWGSPPLNFESRLRSDASFWGLLH